MDSTGGSTSCQELPHLPDDGTGRITTSTSTSTSAAGLVGTIGQANYAAAKAAIVGLTKSAAKELARRSITDRDVPELAVRPRGVRDRPRGDPGVRRPVHARAEYAICRDDADARILRIYGGTTEIMKEIIGRDMGLGERRR